MLLSLIAGLVAGFSLIIAIGAQNVFVLRQGLRREQVGVVVAVCAGSDLLLIMAGVGGIGRLVEQAPVVLVVARWLGAAFLLGYAVLAARRAWRGQRLDVSAQASGRRTGAVIATAAALTWLNPHVYLDTLLLLGSVAATHGDLRWWFGLGAGAASLIWFTALGFGARGLTPLFARPSAWRVLDVLVAVVMTGVAATLVLTA